LIGGRPLSAARKLAAPADLGTVHAIAFHRAVSGRQGAVVRHRLTLATAPGAGSALGVIVTQQAQLQHEGGDNGSVEFFPSPPTQVPRQNDLAKARANEPAYCYPSSLEHPAHFAIAPFFQGNSVPAITAFAAQVFEHAELGNAIFELDALKKTRLLLFTKLAQDPHGVFPFGTIARMRQAIGQVSRSRQNEQTLGVKVQPAHRQPFTDFHFRQTGENGRAPFRIVVTHNLASRLVIQDDAGRLQGVRPGYRSAIDTHLIISCDSLPDMGGLAVHRHTPRNNQFFHLASRTHTSISKNLV
jgi:hypothetical protein